MELTKIFAINRLNISSVDMCDKFADVKFIIARSGANRDPQIRRKHNHKYFQLHYILQGSIVYEIEGNIVDALEGNVVVVPSGHYHSVINQSSDYIKVTVSFNANVDSDIYSILNVSNNYLHKMTPDIFSGIEFVTEQANKCGSFSEMLIKKRLTEMVYILADRLSTGKSKSNENEFSDDRLLKAITYIEDNPGVFFKCYEVAHHCGISSKQLGRLFKKYRNESFLDFIHAQKIGDACQRLLNTDKKVEIIAQELGFSSINYFSKFFIFEVGMPPTEYRKKYIEILRKE